MNAQPARPASVSRIIGAVIVTAALAIGAGVGHLTSTNEPAHSVTPDSKQTCSLGCTDLTRVGGGGNLPNPLNTSGGGGNQ